MSKELQASTWWKQKFYLTQQKENKTFKNILISLKWLDVFIKLETFIVKFMFKMFWYTFPFNNSQLQKTSHFFKKWKDSQQRLLCKKNPSNFYYNYVGMISSFFIQVSIQLHARLNSYYEACSYKKKKHKN